MISNNHDHFKQDKYMKKLKMLSYDESNAVHMTESDLNACDFDKIKDDYIKKFDENPDLTSNDALFISKTDKLYFIEFKNGRICGKEKFNLFRKIYDSLLIYMDITNTTIDHTKNKLNYILVYNQEKNNESNTELKCNISKGKNFMNFVEHIEHLSKVNMDKFGLNKRFGAVFLKKVLTLSATQFDDFLNEIEK